MKQLQLDLNKRLLIVEYETEAECAVEWALMHAFKNPNIVKHGHKVNPICGGSELTEDIAKGLVEIIWNGYKNYNEKEPVGNYQRLVVKNVLESFISAIEAAGYHWGENPVKFKENEMNWEKRHKNRIEWERAESRTFNPEKCIIFEIL